MATPSTVDLVSYLLSTRDEARCDDDPGLRLQAMQAVASTSDDCAQQADLNDAVSQLLASLSDEQAADALDALLEAFAAHLMFDWSEVVTFDVLEKSLFDVSDAFGAAAGDLALWAWTVATGGDRNGWPAGAGEQVDAWLGFRAPTDTLYAGGVDGWDDFAGQWQMSFRQIVSALVDAHLTFVAQWLALRG